MTSRQPPSFQPPSPLPLPLPASSSSEGRLAGDLSEPRFPRSGFLRSGYAVAEVDGFVAELRRALELRPPSMTVGEVAHREFRVRRLRGGYDLHAVDGYLDEAAAVLGRRGAPQGATHREPRTGWIYLVAVLLVVLIVGYAATQLLR